MALSILEFLKELLPEVGDDTNLQLSVLNCFRAWVKRCRIRPEDVVACPIFDACFEALDAESLFDSAVNSVIDLLHRHPAREQNMGIVEATVPR